MDKDKIINVCIWFSVFSLTVFLSALALYIGFNNQRKGDWTILIIGISLLPLVFYCAYKAIKLVLEIIFQ